MSDSTKLGNPVPLGLLGYGMTTVLLSLANVGLIAFNGMILAMAVFFGGLAQMVVAVMLYNKGDTFGVTAFGGYSFLWLSFGFMNIGALEANGWWTVSTEAVGAYLMVWMVFTMGLVVASTGAPRVLTIILILTVVLLGSLGVSNLTGNAALGLLGGWVGIITGALAVYLAFAFLINEMHGTTALPIGSPFRK